MTANPHEPGRISVTLKADGKDATWIVFHGSPEEVRTQIIGVFELTEEQAAGPLFDLVNEATRLFKAAGNVSAGLGGRVINPSSASQSGGGSAWAAVQSGSTAEPEPEVDPNLVRVEAAIAAATSVEAIKNVYARNEQVFKDFPELLEAYKAKGKSLS